MDENNTFYSMHRSNPQEIKAKIIIYVCLFIMLTVILLSLTGMGVSVPEISIANKENIPTPVQIAMNETEMFDHFEMKKVASFELTGRILALREYNKYKVDYGSIDAISPIDMCIGWGRLSTNKYDNYLEFYELTDRTVNVWSKDIRVMPLEEIGISISNTHLIPKTNKIKKQLLSFDKHDLIRIEGYLVEVYDTTGEYLPWKTSTVRTDDGCEIILVEKVYRIK